MYCGSYAYSYDHNAEMEGTGEEEVSWRLVDCVTTSLPNNWRDKVEQLHRLGTDVSEQLYCT